MADAPEINVDQTVGEIKDIIHFLEQYRDEKNIKHLERAKVAVDALLYHHNGKQAAEPSIKIVTNKLVPQNGGGKYNVYIKPTMGKKK